MWRSRVTAVYRALALMAACFVLLTSGKAQDGSGNAPRLFLDQLSASIQGVITKVSPAIVRLEVTGFDRPSEAAKSDTHVVTKSESIASGVILEPDGYIVTNAHALEGARGIRVILDPKVSLRIRTTQPSEYGRAVFEAHIIGIVNEADLALVKIDASGLPVLPLADSDSIHAGQLVFAIGNPEGLNNSVSMGIISAVSREAEQERAPMYIQTDAAINSGSSGGALVDIHGSLVGITSFILTEGGGSEGLGFALPSNLVSLICRELKSSGHFQPVEIGMGVQGITPTLAAGLKLPKDSGLIVSDVRPDSPVDRAGLRAQDILLSIDGNPVDTVAEFATSFYSKHLGDHVQLEILRNSRPFTATVPVVQAGRNSDEDPDGPEEHKIMLRSLCVTVRNLDEKTRSSSERRSKAGILVVDKLSPCDIHTGIEPGDVIRMMNNAIVNSVDGLRSQLHSIRPGYPTVLQVERHHKFRYIALELD